MKEKFNLVQKILFPFYSFLFIFSSINREFLFFGLDLRYILLPLGLALFINGLLDRRKYEKPEKDPVYTCLVIFFVWCLLSNVSWLWSGLDMKPEQMINQNILIANNLLAVLVYRRYQQYVKPEKLKKWLVISCLILVGSFVLTRMGLTLDQISGSDVRSMSVSTAVADQRNIFGGDFRLAGYAEDANYASIFLVIGILSVLQLKIKRYYKIILSVIFLVAFGYSCSKTIIFSFVIGLIYFLFAHSLKTENSLKRILNRIVPIIILLFALFLPNMALFDNVGTMSVRFKLWGIASETFSASPIIGNGISSVRSAVNMEYNNTWYVQTHSNYWQILAETGLVGMVIFLVLMFKCLNSEKINNFDRFAILIFFIFGITFEIIQLQMFAYTIYIADINQKNRRLHE